MKVGWIIKGYTYEFKSRAPLTSDIAYDLGFIWIDSSTNIAYILTSLSGGLGTWAIKTPDKILNVGSGGSIYVIGDTNLGGTITIINMETVSVIDDANAIHSHPGPGERKIESIKMTADDQISIRYESAAQV